MMLFFHSSQSVALIVWLDLLSSITLTAIGLLQVVTVIRLIKVGLLQVFSNIHFPGILVLPTGSAKNEI